MFAREVTAALLKRQTQQCGRCSVSPLRVQAGSSGLATATEHCVLAVTGLPDLAGSLPGPVWRGNPRWVWLLLPEERKARLVLRLVLKQGSLPRVSDAPGCSCRGHRKPAAMARGHSKRPQEAGTSPTARGQGAGTRARGCRAWWGRLGGAAAAVRPHPPALAWLCPLLGERGRGVRAP